MKKIIALILAVIMMFSMTSVSYAADTTVGTETTTTTIDNYMDYLETKLEGENFFVQLIARLVIIGVMLGFIKVEDFEAWFDNTAPDTDTDAEIDNDKPTEDNNTNTDWEDGTELICLEKLPYINEGLGITITNISITKEHYNDFYNGRYVKYIYTIKINGNNSKGLKYVGIKFKLLSDVYGTSKNTQDYFIGKYDVKCDENGNFEYEYKDYSIYEDYSSFFVDYLYTDDEIF